MTGQGLSEQDMRVIKECLKAAVDGPFFPDWEFETLFGLTRAEVGAITAAWPAVEATKEDVRLAINNALANLLC